MNLEDSRARLLDAVSGTDVTLVRMVGNRGDDLIDAGAEELLRDVPHRTVTRFDPPGSGELAVVTGSGAFSRFWYRTAIATLEAVKDYERVVVFPSTFDIECEPVRELVLKTSATLFARDWRSFDDLRDLRPDIAKLALDCAYYFDYGPWMGGGVGVLNAFRTDKEATGEPLPSDNEDISETIPDLDGWLARIANAKEVRSDRAHVITAAALLGKRVRWRPGAYFKVEALAENLTHQHYDVEPL